MRVGVIGVGMVGEAMVRNFIEKGHHVIAYDKFRPGYTDEDMDFDTILECPLIFVSVPTLTLKTGEQDLSPINDVFQRLKSLGFRGVIASKCTTVPGVHEKLIDEHQLRVVHYPEFLREATAYEDFKNQKAVLLSGAPRDVFTVAEFLKECFPMIPMHFYARHVSTEIAKYTHNCFLSVKLSFLNEIFDVCNNFGASYKTIIDGVIAQEKIGENHTQIPGPDGQRGWGGSCFPKDTAAFASMMDEERICADTLLGAIKSNKRRRKD